MVLLIYVSYEMLFDQNTGLGNTVHNYCPVNITISLSEPHFYNERWLLSIAFHTFNVRNTPE